MQGRPAASSGRAAQSQRSNTLRNIGRSTPRHPIVIAPHRSRQALLHSIEVQADSLASATPEVGTSPVADGPSTSGSGEAPAMRIVKQLKLKSAAAYMPHPDKAHYGGEDAHFVSFVGGGALGVADGVGGWADSGINPAAYSRTFMRVACAFVEGADPRASIDGGEALSADASLQGSLSSWEQGSLSSMDGTVPSACPRQAMDWAHKLTDVPGSATACVVSLCQERRALVAANLGDSGFLVLKNGSPALRSRPLQHFFDCPLQFGSLNHVDATDSADQAETFTVPVEPGDVIIMGSDGLWDNAYEAEIVALAPKSASDARAAAQRITEMARDHAADPSFPSPYTQEALKQGLDLPWWEKVKAMNIKDGKLQLGELQGGKMDDITVLVAVVSEEELELPMWPAAAGAAAAMEGATPAAGSNGHGAAVAAATVTVMAPLPGQS